MENLDLELQSVKELRNIAKENGIEVPTKRVKKEEIIEIISKALKVETEEIEEIATEEVETAKWFESKVTARSLKKLPKEALLEYPPFMGNEATYELETADTLKTLILAHIAATKKANDPVRLEKEANFNEVKSHIFEMTEMGTQKLTKEQVALIRSTMQGKTFSKLQRTEIKDMIEDNRLKIATKFVINEEFYEYKDANVVGNMLIHAEGELTHYEACVRMMLRDYGEPLAFAIKDVIDGKVDEIRILEKSDKYTEMSYEILLNDISDESQAKVIAEIEKVYDAEGFPLDYNQLNAVAETQTGSLVQIIDAIGKPHNVRVVQAQPLKVQMYGKYFHGDHTYIDKRYFASVDYTNALTRAEVFDKYTTTEWLENNYDAEKDPALNPEIV